MNTNTAAQLVEKHLNVAYKAAHMIFPRVKEHVEFEELVALANAGLAEAATRYDAAKGASFSTFAWYRVQGSIIDGLRRSTNLPRRTWAKLIALRAASEYLEKRDGDNTESLAQIKSELAAIQTMYTTSLDAMNDAGFDCASPAPHLDVMIDDQRDSAKIRAAIEQLPEKERALMQKHYWEGKNLLEAGEELGISKSWASRLHSQIVAKLRTSLAQ